jgi:hypothetical protein
MTLSWLLHNYQRKLMETLYENPLQSFYLSEFARLSGVDPGNTKRYLEKFAERKIILEEQDNRKTKIRANLANPEARKVFEMFELVNTDNFLAALGARRLNIEGFVGRLVKAFPDIRLIAMNNVKKSLDDVGVKISLVVVVGSKHDINETHDRVQAIVDASGFIHEFNICVYTSDNLESAWNSGDCGCVGFWSDRAVLYGESYYWEMISHTNGGPDVFAEEMVQHV